MSFHSIFTRRGLCVAFLAGLAAVTPAPAQDAPVTAAALAETPALTDSGPVCVIDDYAGFAWTESVAAMFAVPPPYASASASDLPARTLARPFSGHMRPQPAASALTSAPARVFLEDPDDPAPGDIELENLTGDGSRLEGLYARVHSDKLDASGESAPGKDGLADFRFDPILDQGVECTLSSTPEEAAEYCSRLDAVNVYYHIDRVAREYWIDRLGVDIDFQADVTTHIAGDGAFANAEQFVMKMGAGDIFMKNTALEDEIIYHEYAHLATARLGFEINTESSEEARGLSEGYADYFAASYTNDPRIGEWVVTCPPRQHCQGPPNDDEFTRLDLDPSVWNWSRKDDPTLQYGFCLRYHEGDTKCKASYNYRPGIYVWGMIWSNTLWDIRSSVGAATLDPVLVEAIRMHQAGENGDVDFREAVAHVILANRTLNGGEDEAVIRNHFEARGFPIPIIESVEASEETLPGGASLDVYPNPASGTAWVQVTRAAPTEATLRVVDMLGRVVARPAGSGRASGGSLVPVDVSRLPQGVYFVQVVTSSGTTSKRLTVLR